MALRLRVPERGAVTIVTVEPGELIGWSAVVPPYRATATPRRRADELAVIDAAALRELLAADRELAAAFLPLVLESVAARWRELAAAAGRLPRRRGSSRGDRAAAPLETGSPRFLPATDSTT